MLHQRLFGILGGNPPESDRGDFHFDFLAHLGVGFDAPGVEDGKLIVLGNDPFGYDELGEGVDVAVFLVNGHPQVTGRTDRLFGCRKQRLMYSRNQDITVDALFALPKLQDC
jgi:hypothetical protein